MARPPAATGDMLALLGGPACTVVLIDGVFDERPSVWHKEILLLLSNGFRVIGAASMGALRAAELHRFGMIGCGDIFAAYLAGRITGDDEVAIAHGRADYGWKPVSVPQVNVRATLARAAREGIVSVGEARALRGVSAEISFRARVWPEILAIADSRQLATGRLPHWLAAGAIDLKRRDAERALELAATLRTEPAPRLPMPPVTPFLKRLGELRGVCFN